MVKMKNMLVMLVFCVGLAGCNTYPKEPPPCASLNHGPCGPEVPLNTIEARA